MKNLVVYEREDATRSFFCDASVIKYAETGWALVRPDGSIHEFSPDWSFGGDVPYPAYRGWQWLRAVGGVNAMTKRHAVAKA